MTKLENLSNALYTALKKDISIAYYNDNDFAYTINVCKLNSVYSEQVYYEYENSKISRSCGYYWTKEMEKISFRVVRLIGEIIKDSKNKNQTIHKINELFDFYGEQFHKVFEAKYSVESMLTLDKILHN